MVYYVVWNLVQFFGDNNTSARCPGVCYYRQKLPKIPLGLAHGHIYVCAYNMCEIAI